MSEYQTYLKNKDIAGVTFSYVDDPRIYRFLEEVHALPNNNAITAFGSTQDIIFFLREQWAGMFQRFLKTQERLKEVEIVKDLQANMQTLDQLISYISAEKQNSDEAIHEILRANHPIFSELRRLLNLPFRIYFTNRSEFTQLLKGLRFYEPVHEDQWDSPEFEEWILNIREKNSFKLLKVHRGVFDEKGDLVIYTPSRWKNAWISLSSHERPVEEEDPSWITDDDVPF